MIKFGKTQRVGDHVFNHETSSEVPQGLIIQTKGNKHGQIEDVSPRFVDGVDLFSKYYHRDARIYVDMYFNEVIKLHRREEARHAQKS